ncbi:MAG TPA: nitroreductase family protein [Candidatus Binatia bacterium]|nr:nitroreductase family protein [Candidatus Binatia bacterium]
MDDCQNSTYEMLLDLVKSRHSVRKFKADPIPDNTIEKILEVARWAMSGANSQPWEFVVVTEPEIKKALRDAYSEYNTDLIFWMEQQREYNLRHPSYQVKNDPHESLRFNKAKANWHLAPAVIVVLGDGRRQWGTVMGAHTFGRDQSHLTDSLANASFLIHLAVAALGLTSEWVSIHVEEPHKRILGVPDLLKLYLIIPIGYPDVPVRTQGVRRPLNDMLHRERYDMGKYMSNEDIIKYLYSLREATLPVHSASRAVSADKKG